MDADDGTLNAVINVIGIAIGIVHSFAHAVRTFSTHIALHPTRSLQLLTCNEFLSDSTQWRVLDFEVGAAMGRIMGSGKKRCRKIVEFIEWKRYILMHFTAFCKSRVLS